MSIFEIRASQINDLLRNRGIKERLKVTCYNDNCFDLHKICKDGEKKYLRSGCSSKELECLLDGFYISINFE